MKISDTDAIQIAKKLIQEQEIPYDMATANYVEKQNYWLVAFEKVASKSNDLMDGNVSFVTVDAETGEAALRPNP